MTSVFKQKWRVALAAVALGSIGMSGQVFAQATTASGTTITNTATVNYSVSSIAQTPINAAATFLVDTVINENVTGGNSYTVTPGQTGVIGVFTVTNTSNVASGFTLAATNRPQPAEDDFDMLVPGSTTTFGYSVFVDANGNGTYEPATDTATSIASLAAYTTATPASVTVFVVADTPTTPANTNKALARLTATAVLPSTTTAWTATGAGVADDPNTVQIVVRNASVFAQDTFTVASASLSVTKTSAVISDPFLGVSANAKAIPAAVVEYSINVSNAVGAQTATVTSISDPVPTTTTVLAGQYTGARDVGVKVGAAAEVFCIAEVGADTNGDGCRINAGAVTVGAPAITTIPANSSIVVRFRVTIK
jgi:hypothetical protein